MRKISCIILAGILSVLFSESYGQFPTCSPLKFSGIAPSPWAIDGQISDWETILGPVNALDPVFPFGASIGNNGSYDTYGANDPDNPDPQSDLRVLATIHDDYNVFFYFRRLNNINSPNKAFYFLDLNIDGYINTGEPVIAVYMNGQRVHKLAMCRYIASNSLGDPDNGNAPIGTCLIDGSFMPGTIEELFKSNNTDLLPNEIFDAEVTEDGYGVELAVPWRFISQYKLFGYHLALQKGGGSYNPNVTADDASGCDILLDIIGEPEIEIGNINVTPVIPGLSFRIDITFTNLTPATVKVTTTDLVVFNNIIQRDALPIDETQFSVIINGLPYHYFDGTFSDQPIRYSSVSSPGAGQFYLQPFQTRTISIFISFPPNYSVLSAEVELQPSVKFFLVDDCNPNTGGGGKPTNPIGFSVGEETATKQQNNGPLKEQENTGLEKIIIYPNPSKGSSTLLLPGNEEYFDIYLSDYMGRLIRKWNHIDPGHLKLNIPMKGFYMLRIRGASGNETIKKLIVQ